MKKEPVRPPALAFDGDTLIELYDDMFHHYVYNISIPGWEYIGSVASLFHVSMVGKWIIDDPVPEPETAEDAYERAMGILR